ncbi:MAG: GHKL domain-containing protein [Oscillospiraceae bacterium]|nr:GHKL domain-containing protein [Oscillospiraceae bacterium]
MTFDDLKSFLEKKNRRCAVLDADFKLLWDKDGFFGSWKINFPKKEDFYDKKEIIISLGNDKIKIPVSITKLKLSSGETRYICEAFEREIVSELASKSEISELLKNYLAGINDKIQAIQFLAEQCSQNPLVQSDDGLAANYKTQAGAAFDLLALSTNLNYYFNTFSYADSDSKTDVFKTVDSLVKKCNELLGNSVITLSSKESGRLIKIPERVFTVVFLNLIQNALLYSKTSSKIAVKVFYDNENATVSVTNEVGENSLPASESIRLGIGLPLVERIVTNIGGKLINEREGTTYKAHISLPLYVRSGISETVLEQKSAEFITQNTSYVKRYLNQFIK